MTTAHRPTRPVEPGAAPLLRRNAASLPRWVWALVVLGVWIVSGPSPRARTPWPWPARAHTDVHDRLTGFRDDILAGRDTNP